MNRPDLDQSQFDMWKPPNAVRIQGWTRVFSNHHVDSTYILLNMTHKYTQIMCHSGFLPSVLIIRSVALGHFKGRQRS